MTHKNRHSGALLLASLALIFTQLACKTVMRGIAPEPTAASQLIIITPTPRVLVVTATPSSGPTPQAGALVDGMSDDEISQGIQQALDLYAQAYNDNNPSLLEESVDQENKPFRRI